MSATRHGNRCTCRSLAEAVGADPKTLTFNYCRSVIQRRWAVECNHCYVMADLSTRTVPAWEVQHDDPVKAILLINE